MQWPYEISGTGLYLYRFYNDKLPQPQLEYKERAAANSGKSDVPKRSDVRTHFEKFQRANWSLDQNFVDFAKITHVISIRVNSRVISGM